MTVQAPGGPLLKYSMPTTTRPARTADPAAMPAIAPPLNPACSFYPIGLTSVWFGVFFGQAHQSAVAVVELAIL